MKYLFTVMLVASLVLMLGACANSTPNQLYPQATTYVRPIPTPLPASTPQSPGQTCYRSGEFNSCEPQRPLTKAQRDAIDAIPASAPQGPPEQIQYADPGPISCVAYYFGYTSCW